MNRSITPDTTPPTITARTPAPGSAGVNVGTLAHGDVQRVDERRHASRRRRFQLKDPANAVVPATVAYDSATKLGDADAAGGAAVRRDLHRHRQGRRRRRHGPRWQRACGRLELVVHDRGLAAAGARRRLDDEPIRLYLGEILRNEGLNAFTTIDVAFVSPALLAQFDVVVLGETPLNAAQVTTLTDWVNGGGNLVAMRPDKQLAGLLGLTDAGTTLTNAYLQVNTASGAGHRDRRQHDPVPRHRRPVHAERRHGGRHALLERDDRDRRTRPSRSARSARAAARRPRSPTTSRARSSTRGRATRPGRARSATASPGIRPDDLFFGARAGDVQPDWIDTNKIAIPQADEQQRLLLNLITRWSATRCRCRASGTCRGARRRSS